MRFLNKILLVDELSKKAPGSFTDFTIATDETAEIVLVLRLLDKVKGSEWLPFCCSLASRYTNNQSQEAILVARYYYSFLKTCIDKPNLVAAELADRIPQEDFCWRLWLQVYLALPAHTRGSLLDRFIDKWPNISGDIVRDELQAAAVELLLNKNSQNPTPFLNNILAFRAPNEKNIKSNISNPDLLNPTESTPRFSVHAYQGLLSFLYAQAPEDSRLLVLSVLIPTLHTAIEFSIPEEEKSVRNGEDGSTYWRSAIEPHEQNHDYGYKEQLVTAIRDFSEHLLENNPDSKSELDSLLTKSKWFVFTRLRLHLFRKFPELFQSEIHASLLDPELRDKSSIWHEWALLFSEQFKNLDTRAKDDLLAWIKCGDDLQASIEFYKSRHEGTEPSVEIQAAWQAHWQLRRLSLIESDLTGYWKQKFEDLSSKYDPVEEPDLLHHSSGFTTTPEISLISTDQLKTMGADEIVSAVQGWVQTDRFDGPSEWGLREALKQDAKRDPRKYLNDPEVISQLSTDRLVTVLSACFEAGNEGAPLDWSQFLSFIQTITKQRILPDAKKVDPDTGYIRAGIDLIRNLEVGIEKRPSTIPFECRAKVWELILLFLQHPEPSTDRKTDNTGTFDLISESLNTSRGAAFRCIFIYANWVMRQAGNESGENPAIEILDALDDRLAHDEALSIRAIFGERFPWLLHFHREWTIERIPQIFPSDPESVSKRAAAWESFLVYAQASDQLLEAMASLYREAVLGLSGLELTEGKNSGQDTPTKGLVHHLMALYWFGSLPIEGGSLLWDFYQIAPVWLRAYSLEYIGRSLSNTKGDIPPQVAERFIKLADWRIETLKNQPELERQELEGFFAWVPALNLDEDWLFQTTYSVLQLIGKWTNYYHHSLFEPLAAYSTKNPLLAVQCLAEMLKREESYGLWGNEEEIKTILRHARDCDNEIAIRLHEDVQDALLRMYQLQFMSLDANPKKLL